MRIYSDLTPLLHYPGGIPTYIISLYKLLLKKETVEIHTGENCIHPSSARRFRNTVHDLLSHSVQVKCQFFPGRIDLSHHPFLLKLFALPTDQFDICHIPGNIASKSFPIRKWDNVVLTIHDMFLFHHDSFIGRNNSTEQQNMLKSLPLQASKAAHIITDSDFSKKEIIHFLSLPPDKISVIPLATQWEPDQHSSFPPKQTPHLLPNSYFLAVSNLFRHKNYVNLLKAYRLYSQKTGGHPFPLVIVGHGNDAPTLEAIQNTPGVIHLQTLSSEELCALYQNALGFFQVSYLEGFGIPLLEAMSMKCPACYATGSSMNEIGRDAAWRVSPENVDAMAEVFSDFAELQRKDSPRVEQANRISQEYSWEKTAAQTYKLFQRLCNPSAIDIAY